MTTVSPGYELAVERYIAATPALVWQAMTERLTDWWCPKPWRTEVIEWDLRSGGRNAVVMHGPDGEHHPHEGVFLEVVVGRRFVSTDAFVAGWVPTGPFMVGIWELTPDGDGTQYRAAARHWSEAEMIRHRDMGFEQGWGVCADQLKALCEGAGTGA